MGSTVSTLLTKEDIQDIVVETGFSSSQIKRLYNRFTTLDKNNMGYLTRQDFLRIPELHVNPLRDRVIEVLIEDSGSDDKINFKQFAKVLSTFRRSEKKDEFKTNNRENRLKFLFNVYDRDKDERINRQELLSILNMLVGANLPEEQMGAIAERAIAEIGDTDITFKQFCDTLEKIDVDDKMSMKFLV
jgi:calcineurin B homologous protein 1